mmetsp:Transcript_41508/g.87998  ORF Transcript_41508/g.87998 Transcript_41508/m.87998 type:complete len:230 (+) Transcript_41508:58-747(+)
MAAVMVLPPSPEVALDQPTAVAPAPSPILTNKKNLRRTGSVSSVTTQATTEGSATPTSSEAGVDRRTEQAEKPVFLQAVKAQGPFEDALMAELVRQVHLLSNDCFQEECLAGKAKHRLDILASEDRTQLLGFCVSKFVGGTLSLAKLAVPETLRGKGYGRTIVTELTKAANKRPEVYEIGLSSLPEAVVFYKRLGFKADMSINMGDDDDDRFIPGQVYMARRLRRRPRK